MNRRTKIQKPAKQGSPLSIKARLLSVLRRPKSTLVFVVLCLFVVVMNWAVQRSAWMPLPEEISASTNSQGNPVAAPTAPPKESRPKIATQRVPDTRTGWDFFHPAWRETPDLDLVGSPKFHPNSWTVSDTSLKRLAGDPYRRMEPAFQVTADVRERVLFWLRIHTQYNSYMRVLHDRNNPSIIYGVADFSPLFNETNTDVNALTKVYRFERQILKELKARMTEAAGLSRAAKLTPWERNELRTLLSRAGALGGYESAVAIRSIRSQTGQRDEFIMALTRSEDLLPYIEATFKSFGLPVALARIPFVESSFNPRAYSKVGATGIFQFMPFTARQMISPTRPELWSDPLLQTRAAARMLLILRSMLPDWSTTVTAYNSGVGRLQRISRKHHAKSIGPLLEIQEPTGLGFAGKNFYAQFLSANIAEAYRREIFPLRRRDEEEVYLAFERPRNFARRFHTIY